MPGVIIYYSLFGKACAFIANTFDIKFLLRLGIANSSCLIYDVFVRACFSFSYKFWAHAYIHLYSLYFFLIPHQGADLYFCCSLYVPLPFSLFKGGGNDKGSIPLNSYFSNPFGPLSDLLNMCACLLYRLSLSLSRVHTHTIAYTHTQSCRWWLM